MPFVQHNHASIHYQTAGDPAHPAVVLIHAGIADLRMWDSIAAPLAERYFVLRYDTRGFGLTTTENVSYSNRDDLRALMDAVGIDRAAVIGCSRGGTIAMDFTLEHPSRVRKLVMVCSTPSGLELDGPFPPEQVALDEQMMALEEAGQYEELVALEVRMWVDGFGRSPDAVNPDVRQAVLMMNLESIPHLSEKATPTPLDPPAFGRLGEIACPVLITTGAHDESVPEMAAPILLKRIPNASYHQFAHSAHVPSMEEPDEFLRVVGAFLAQPDSP
jgi:3-oxoadipate enol-lactonase